MISQINPKSRDDKIAPGYVTASAALVALMVTTGWAFFAVIPVAAMTIASWTDARIRALRWWTSLTAGLYAVPFTQYLLRADRAASMSDLLNPYMAAAIAFAAAVVLLKILKSHRD